MVIEYHHYVVKSPSSFGGLMVLAFSFGASTMGFFLITAQAGIQWSAVIPLIVVVSLVGFTYSHLWSKHVTPIEMSR